jgi:hypothetical protein
MATASRDTILPEEFERRLDNSNARLRQELTQAIDRVQRLEALIVRKEAFEHRLAQILAEVEREESEIAALEQGLRSARPSARRPSASQAPQ